MKVCVPTNGIGGIDDVLCPHFGRAPTFTIVDTDSGSVQVVANISEHAGGSGLPTDHLIPLGVDLIIVGGLGPRAVDNFVSAGIEVYLGASGTAKKAIEDWKSGNLQKANRFNACQDHRH